MLLKVYTGFTRKAQKKTKMLNKILALIRNICFTTLLQECKGSLAFKKQCILPCNWERKKETEAERETDRQTDRQ